MQFTELEKCVLTINTFNNLFSLFVNDPSTLDLYQIDPLLFQRNFFDLAKQHYLTNKLNYKRCYCYFCVDGNIKNYESSL